MTNDKLKSLIREILQPVYDELVDCVFGMYEKVLPNVPADLTDQQAIDFVKPLLEAQAESLKQSFKSIDISKLATQAKEKQNGSRRS